MDSVTKETECTQEFSIWTHKDSGLMNIESFVDGKYTTFSVNK